MDKNGIQKQNKKFFKKELLIDINQVWLVQWTFMSEKEDEDLRKFGINEKIVDVVSVRRSFDDIINMARDIYARNQATFSEKVDFAHYVNGVTHKEKFCELSGPISTHYKSTAYRNLMNCSDITSKECTEFLEEWKKHSEYVQIGYNPGLKIEKVYNLKVFNLKMHKDDWGHEIVEWNKKIISGGFKKERYEFDK